MDISDFRIMVQRHDPWLLNWIASRMGQFKLAKETVETFKGMLARKVEAITELSWEKLDTKEELSPSVTPVSNGYVLTTPYYTVIWRKNDEEKVSYAGMRNTAGLCADQLLRLVFTKCQDGDTPWVVGVVKTVYVINTTSKEAPKHTFTIYPCEEKLFMSWVDQHEAEINEVLAQQHLTLSRYSVVALK